MYRTTWHHIPDDGHFNALKCPVFQYCQHWAFVKALKPLAVGESCADSFHCHNDTLGRLYPVGWGRHVAATWLHLLHNSPRRQSTTQTRKPSDLNHTSAHTIKQVLIAVRKKNISLVRHASSCRHAKHTAPTTSVSGRLNWKSCQPATPRKRSFMCTVKHKHVHKTNSGSACNWQNMEASLTLRGQEDRPCWRTECWTEYRERSGLRRRRKLHSQELHDTYPSLNVITVSASTKKINLPMHEARTGREEPHTWVDCKPEGMTPVAKQVVPRRILKCVLKQQVATLD